MVQSVPSTANSQSSQTSDMLQIGQRVHWKREDYTGEVKWVSPTGLIVGVDFDQEIDEFTPGWEPYTDFFEFRNGHGRILPSSEFEKEGEIKANVVETPARKELNNNGVVSCGTGRARLLFSDFGRPGVGLHECLGGGWKFQQKESSELSPKILPKPSVNYEYLSGGRGVEWQSNSCYLDSTLFALFYSISLFDDVMFSVSSSSVAAKSEIATRARQILKYEVVYPLRRHLKCSGANVAKLRAALSQFNKKLISSFMDAEDFLFILLEQCLGLHEFIVYTNGVQDFLHQIIIDMGKARSRRIDSIQSLLTTSMGMLDDNLKFNGVPNPALLIEMPRSDGRLVGYKAVVPNLTLDLSELMSSVNCACEKPAKWACRQCARDCKEFGRVNNTWTTFCNEAAELHRRDHEDHALIPLSEYHSTDPVVIDLVSVICIRDSHYVAFTKFGNEKLSPWLFLNSMHKVEPVPDLGLWLQKIEDSTENQAATENLVKECPASVRRVLLDSHICIYAKR